MSPSSPFRPKPAARWLLCAAAACLALPAAAQTTVADAWARATVPKQMGTGLFAKITSVQGGRLVSAASPVAGVVEIHEMAMDANSVMRMRAVPGLDLPAGKAVELKPGGFHIMLMDLKQPLTVGSQVPLQLVVQDKDGKRQTLEVSVPVKATATGPDGGKKDEHSGHKHH